jgi:hypothetical protein
MAVMSDPIDPTERLSPISRKHIQAVKSALDDQRA